MTKKVNFSLPQWVYEEVLQDPDNRSQRITELLIKGHLYEQTENLSERVFQQIMNRLEKQMQTLHEDLEEQGIEVSEHWTQKGSGPGEKKEGYAHVSLVNHFLNGKHNPQAVMSSVAV
jgi:hypothetical protein